MKVLEYYMYIIVVLAMILNTKFREIGVEEENKVITKNRKVFVFVAMFGLFLISALKSEYFSGDVYRYFDGFRDYLTYSFDKIIDKISNGSKDPGFTVFAWLFGQIIPNPYIWTGLLAALFIGAVGLLIYKESKLPLLSIIMFISLGFFAFSLTGIRQTLAMAFTVFSYKYIKNKKPVKFILCVLLGSLFHQSALVFLIAYPLSRLKLGFKHIIVVIIGILIFFLFQSEFKSIVEFFFREEERYEVYFVEKEKLNASGLIIQIFMFLYSLFYYKKSIEDDKNNLMLYNLSFFGMVFQSFTSVITVFFRISLYFSIFNIILIPNASMCEIDKKTTSFFQLIIGGILILYLFYFNTMDYIFFWEL